MFAGDAPEGHVLLAALYARRHEWAKAHVEIHRALEGGATLPLANYLHGQAMMHERGDWAGAAEAFRAELARDENHFESNLLLGNLLREEGRHDEALVHLNRAASLRADDLALKISLGATLLATGSLERSRQLLEEVAVAAPGHLPTHMQLAVLYTRLGRKDEADRARGQVARLQKEADGRSFQGVRESITDILGMSAPGTVAGRP